MAGRPRPRPRPTVGQKSSEHSARGLLDRVDCAYPVRTDVRSPASAVPSPKLISASRVGLPSTQVVAGWGKRRRPNWSNSRFHVSAAVLAQDGRVLDVFCAIRACPEGHPLGASKSGGDLALASGCDLDRRLHNGDNNDSKRTKQQAEPESRRIASLGRADEGADSAADQCSDAESYEPRRLVHAPGI